MLVYFVISKILIAIQTGTSAGNVLALVFGYYYLLGSWEPFSTISLSVNIEQAHQPVSNQSFQRTRKIAPLLPGRLWEWYGLDRLVDWR